MVESVSFFFVYKIGGYLEVVNTYAKLLIMKVVAEVKALPKDDVWREYVRWKITDLK